MILFIGAFLAYLVAFALSALEATLIRRERASAVIEPITFLRISIIGLLAIFLAQAFLELAHLMAERTDRQVHRRGGAGQVAQACGSDEALQGMQRWAGHKP